MGGMHTFRPKRIQNSREGSASLNSHQTSAAARVSGHVGSSTPQAWLAPCEAAGTWLAHSCQKFSWDIQAKARKVGRDQSANRKRARGSTSSLLFACIAAPKGLGASDGAGLEHREQKSAPLPNLKAIHNLSRAIFDGCVAGAAAGVTVETALYPIDTIKTRLQVVRGGGAINLKGLYAGLSGNIAGVLPASAIFVGVYEPLKLKLLDLFPPNWSAAAHLSAGGLGGLVASLVRVPTEVVKQRMQTGQFPTVAKAVGGILAAEGAGGLYAGYRAFLLRDLPFDALQFAIYEQLKIAGKAASGRELKDIEMAAIGAVSGALTGALTTPLDVIKTRLMVQGNTGEYKGVMDCIAKTWAEDGASAFLKGVGPRVLWIGIGGSIFFTVLEKTKQAMETRRAQKS